MNPPFYIGQKVVALITDTIHGRAVKGNIYTVSDIKKYCKCSDGWVIDIGAAAPSQYMDCGDCGTRGIKTNEIGWSWYGHFAPIEENRIRYVAVSETLRETAVEIAAIETN